MIKFDLEKTDNPNKFDLTFYKIVHKRSGDFVEEPYETLYSIPLTSVKLCITIRNTENVIGDTDVSFKTYLSEYYKSYNEVCELLKKIL